MTKKHLSLRFSEYESIETAKNLINKSKWIWIDTFKILPVKRSNVRILKKFKSCLVCPERWGRPHDIKNYFNKLKRLNFFPNSIMTSKKYAKAWENQIRLSTSKEVVDLAEEWKIAKDKLNHL